VKGTFLLIGPAIEPRVAIISINQMRALDEGMAVAAKYATGTAREATARHEVYRSIFGCAAHYAVPCWVPEAMAMIATKYEGPHAPVVKWMAARIALGKTYSREEWDAGKPRDPKDGGRKANLDPPKPAPKKPGGAAVQLLFGDSAKQPTTAGSRR
jgi:hypothetical protein